MVRSWQGMALNKPIGSVLKDHLEDGPLRCAAETCGPLSSGLATSAHFDTFTTKGVDVIVVDSTDALGAATNAQRAIEARHKHNRRSHTPVCIKATSSHQVLGLRLAAFSTDTLRDRAGARDWISQTVLSLEYAPLIIYKNPRKYRQ